MTAASNPHGCSVKPVLPITPKTVSVNGVVIARAAISREMQNHPAGKPIDAWRAAARALVIRELLLQEARRLALVAHPVEDDEGRRETEEEALVRQLVEQEVRTPGADEAACRRYYEANRRLFRSPDLCEARHILLPAAPDDAGARAAALVKARALIEELRAAPHRFAHCAHEASACPSASNGGNLGQLGPGQTAPEFEKALVAAPEGEVSPQPVETRYGVHVLMVERRIAGRDLPFELVRSRIAEWLEEKVRRTAIRQYIELLAGRAEIVGVEMASSATPLVQ